MNILIVDDEPMMLEMAEDTVREVKPDADIAVFSNPYKAFESANEKH